MTITNVSSFNGIRKLEAFYNLKQREIFCPVNKQRVLTTPLTVGDDLSLRTMIVSPEVYDRELASLIFKHVKFVDSPEQVSFDTFTKTFSTFDRQLLLYGIYATTYAKISEDEVTCDNCSNTFKDVIKPDEIIDAEFCTVWDKDESFLKYTKDIEIVINDGVENTINSLVFITKIPTIENRFGVFNLVSAKKMKDNFEKTGQILTRAEDLCLITKEIKIVSNLAGKADIDHIDTLQEISIAINKFITPDVIDTVISEYNLEFSKYNPKFKKKYTCTRCGHNFEIPVNIEASLFRSFFKL